MTRISIIVPVYNVEKYIKECVYSILDQMSKKDELILVDDGSSDTSGILCDGMKELDYRIKVIHKKNEGVTVARRVGIEAAKGKWIMFVDADDTLPYDAIQNLYNASQIYDTEIVIGFSYEREESEYASQILLENYRINNIMGEPLSVAPWGRLIRHSIFNKNTLDIPQYITHGEDMLMNLRLSFSMRKKPVLVYRKVYNYRTNNEGLSHAYKESFEYEEKFYEVMRQSIPLDAFPNCEKAFITKRLLWFNKVYRSNPLSFKWLNSKMYIQLISDINHTSYKMNLLDKIKFKGNIKNNRLFVYIIVRIYEFFLTIFRKLKFIISMNGDKKIRLIISKI